MSGHDPEAPARFLVDRMRAVDQEVTHRVHDHLVAAGVGSIRIAHSRLMAELEGGARPSELARRLGVTKGAVGQLVDRLERDGLVERVPDPADGRAHLVRPTAKAELAYRSARRRITGIEDEWRSILGPGRMRELERALEALDAWRAGDGNGGSFG